MPKRPRTTRTTSRATRPGPQLALSASTTAAPLSSTVDVDSRIARLEQLMLTMMERTVGSATPAPIVAAADSPAAPIKNTRHITPRIAPAASLDNEVARALAEHPEPKRQRKERNLPPRTLYRLKSVKSAASVKALQSLTPAASSIVVYLATHEQGATVPDLAVQLDLKKKTIENLLSILYAKDLIEREVVPHKG